MLEIPVLDLRCQVYIVKYWWLNMFLLHLHCGLD